MALLVANRPLYHGRQSLAPGDLFEVEDRDAAEMIGREIARRPDPPKVVYETKVIVPGKTPGVEAPEVSPRLPFVTCLCLTRNRRQWLPKAIKSYQGQTYQNRELLIVADGQDVRDLVEPIMQEDPSIRFLVVEGSPQIGDKRNLAASNAAGEIIVHFDDDDWSEPGRVEEQVQQILAADKSVVGYRAMKFTDGARWWKYTAPADYALGTSLCYRKSWWDLHRFKRIHVAEDEAFVNEANMFRQFVSVDAGEAMYATVHSGNTSPRNISGNRWKLLTN